MNSWINAEERKPKENQFVLCISKEYGICVGYRWIAYEDDDGFPKECSWSLCPLKIHDDGVWWAAEDDDSKEYPRDDDVAFWMPLPEPPNEL